MNQSAILPITQIFIYDGIMYTIIIKSIVLIVYYSMFLYLEFVPPNYAQKWFTVYHTHICQI